MKRNLTFRLDANLIRQARLLAAKEGKSLSALVATKLEAVGQRGEYDAAHRRALARLRKGYDLGFAPASSRDELHER